MTDTTPTPRQQEVLDWIRHFQKVNRVSPSIREIGDHFGIFPFAVQKLLDGLQKKGLIQFYGYGSSRRICFPND